MRLLLLGLLLSFSLALGRSIYTQANKFKEISKVEGEAQKLEGENESLKRELEKAKHPESLEKEARDKLGYQRAGEVLFVVEQKESPEEKKLKSKKSWQLWTELFFGTSD